jgi:hypothetical protein
VAVPVAEAPDGAQQRQVRQQSQHEQQAPGGKRPPQAEHADRHGHRDRGDGQRHAAVPRRRVRGERRPAEPDHGGGATQHAGRREG